MLSLAFLIPVALPSCKSAIPNREILGQGFPAVVGESLAGERMELPAHSGPAVLLVGYAQDAQFDADRWIYGLLQAKPTATILEVPTIPGLFPRVASGWIDSGMRSGIPSEDWASVVTVYGSDAGRIAEFTGNEKPRNIRVLLLDSEGRVRWFHDRGFSAGKLLELDQAIRALPAQK
ncbi:MAG: hypothetical protein IPJ19_15435 [Planctomycetes bacterium]|nr:hypothetical protein [Planctomycetota bacterium]